MTFLSVYIFTFFKFFCSQRLIDHQVIRHKLAEMVTRVESCHAMLEQICYQLNNVCPMLPIYIYILLVFLC